MGEIFIYKDNKISPKKFYRSSWKKKLRKSSKICKWCKKPIQKTGKQRATIDHIIPKSREGPDTPLNTKVSCSFCNEGRAATGHCILILVCIEAIVGRSLSKIALYYNQSVSKTQNKETNLCIFPLQSPQRDT